MAMDLPLITTPRASAKGTVSAIVLKPMIAFAEARGLDADAILRSIRLDAGALDDFDHRIPDGDRRQVWNILEERLRDPYVALAFAPTVPLGAYDALDYGMALSPTFGDAMDRVTRFYRLLCDTWALAKEVDGDALRLRRLATVPGPETEAFAAVLVLRGRALVGEDLRPREVTFAHPLTAPPKAYVDFFQCPVRHGSVSSTITFARADLERPTLAPHPGLNRVLDRYMNGLLERSPVSTDPIVEDVRAVIARFMRDGARPTLHRVAASLRWSQRTLQRRLGERDTSFAALVESERRAMAERLVRDRRLSLTEIAYLLGFQDLSGFRKAYRGWTGTTPSSARQRTK